MSQLELAPWVGVIGTLAGTILGFGFSKFDERRRAIARRKKMIKSLIAELTDTHILLSGLKVEKARETGFVEIRNPLLTDVYRGVKAEITGEINENTYLKLQRCYLEIREIDYSREIRYEETRISYLDKMITEVISELKKEL